MNTTTPVNVLKSEDMVPELVMQSAESWPQGQGLNLTLPYLTSYSGEYCVSFYFAEIDPLAQNQTRVFDMFLNLELYETYYGSDYYNLSGYAGMYVTIEQPYRYQFFNSSGRFQLIPHADSQLGPILNALELFLSTPPAPNVTFVSDG